MIKSAIKLSAAGLPEITERLTYHHTPRYEGLPRLVRGLSEIHADRLMNGRDQRFIVFVPPEFFSLRCSTVSLKRVPEQSLE